MWITIPQLSKLSGLSEKRIRRYITNGMRYYQDNPGGLITVRMSDLEDYRKRFVRCAEREMPDAIRILSTMREIRS